MSDPALRRSSSHDRQRRFSEATIVNPADLEHPQSYYERADTLNDLDVDYAQTLVAEQDRRKAEVNRRELDLLLDEIVSNRESPEQPRDVLVQWKHDVLTSLKTPQNPGWNYLYVLNFNQICKYFVALRDSKTHSVRKLFGANNEKVQIVTSDGPVEKYTATRILQTLKLKDVEHGRKPEQALTTPMAIIYNVLNLDNSYLFMLQWQSGIVGTIQLNPRNFEVDENWHRVEAVLGYVRSTVEHKDMVDWRRLSPQKRFTAFVDKYKWEEVVAKMRLEPPLAKSGKRANFRNMLGRGGSSSQASLNHSRRLGLRQVKMRGLVPLGKAEDGGYYY